MRAFVAWQPSDSERASIAALRDALRAQRDDAAVRWVDDAQLHVTVRFLGEIEAAVARRIDGAIARLAAASLAFEARVAGWQYWPDRRSPRVLVLRLESAGRLERLAAAIEHEVVAAGVPTERRAFRAHLTLARLSPGAAMPAPFTTPSAPLVLRIDALTLVHSTLAPAGARHAALARHALAVA